MVYFKRDLPLPGDCEPDDTYWAIGGTAVETASMRSATSMTFPDYKPRPFTGDDAVAHHDRQARGVPNYGACLVKELKELIRARNIDVPKNTVRKAALIAELEKADENIKFTKFFQLPAELRTNVYEKYFEGLGDLPLLPHQPPALLASRQLRNEALPAYYSHSTFTLGFVTNLRTPVILSGRKPGLYLRTTTCKKTDALLKRISEQDFATIKHLKIQVWKPELDAGDNVVSFATWTADLTGLTKSAITHEHQDYKSNVWTPVFKAVGEALEPALEVFRQKPGVQKIAKADVYSLMGVVHEAMM